MEFKRANRTLKNLEQKKELSLVDILGIFQDVCNDLEEEQGQTLDELELGNENFVGKLLWIGQEVVDVFQSKVKAITNPKQEMKVSKQAEKLRAELNDLANVENEVKILQEQEKQLLAIHRQQEETGKMKRQLAKRCKDLEDEISQYETVSLKQLEQKKKFLEEQKYQMASKGVLLEKELAKLEEERSVLTREVQVKQTKVAALKDALNAGKNENSMYAKQIADMETESQQLKMELEIMRSKIEDMDFQKKEMIVKINSLDENMKTMNIEVLRKRYEEKANAYAELEQEIARLDSEQKILESNIEHLQKRIQEIDTETEEKQIAIVSLKRRKQELLENTESIKQRKEQLEAWFRGMEYQAYEEQMQRIQKRLIILNKAKAALGKEVDHELFMSEEISDTQIRVFREELEVKLRDIQKEIDNIQRRYMIVSKVIYGEGESLL